MQTMWQKLMPAKFGSADAKQNVAKTDSLAMTA